MNKLVGSATTCSCLAAALLVLLLLAATPAAAVKPDKDDKCQDPNRDKNSTACRLDRIEAKLDALLGPQTAATFCISQGRALELGLDWAAELKVELEGGVGWAEVGDVKATLQPTIPALITGIPLLRIIPTEAKIGVAGGLGRGLEICVEIPLTLSPEDDALLMDLWVDINDKTGNGGLGDPKGKFQRRAGRVLNYAKRRIPGRQSRGSQAVFDGEEDIETEFDRADTAAEALLEGGIGELSDGMGVSEGMDAFRDVNVKELLATLETPVDLSHFMGDPEMIFDGLPDLSGGFDRLTCGDLGVSAGMRSRNLNLDHLCNELAALPSFALVRDAFGRVDELPLPEDIVEAITELLAPVLSAPDLPGGGETKEEAKSRFCKSEIGKRKRFDKYCGR